MQYFHLMQGLYNYFWHLKHIYPMWIFILYLIQPLKVLRFFHSLTAAPLISYMPQSTEELVSLYLKRNPEEAKSGLQEDWHSPALDSVVLDAVAYAHRSLLS